MLNPKKLANLKDNVIREMQNVINKSVHNISHEKEEICFIALEYFYDGVAIDIGLRIGSEEERICLQSKKGNDYDIREDGGEFKYYEPLLDNKKIKSHSDVLFKYLKKFDDEDSNVTYTSIKDIVRMMTRLMNETNWAEYAKITEDFAVLGPYEYD